MSFLANLARAAIVGIALALAPSFANAQEISASHLAAALDVVKSAKASRGFDNVLPTLAGQVEDRYIRLRPDLHKEITAAVENAALKLAARRTDLDNDVARVWAKHFSEDELKTIAAFYKTDAGKKFADVGSLVYAETLDAVSHWSDRLGEELLDKAKEEMKTAGITF
ncbi:MAG TPA: DUF2059 domain-containing protein [Bauldia sp.]|nr:DUF2059 domain-containing protein [Bauldia sp.]